MIFNLDPPLKNGSRAAVQTTCGEQTTVMHVIVLLLTGATSSGDGKVEDSDADAEEEEGWTDSAIRALITVRHEMDCNFQTPKSKKSKLWIKVAAKVKELL